MDLVKSPVTELIAQADGVRKERLGSKLELCGIINAKSGLCSEDCKFCAQSACHSTGVETYSLKKTEEIVKAAANAKSIGAEKFGIVTSGNSLDSQEMDNIADAIRRIDGEVGISVCASLGALDKHQLGTLKSAGLKRYHHNIETSRTFYPNIVSTHDFTERLKTIEAAKESGLQVCSGGIIGLGETWEDRIDMARLLKELDVDSVPLNLLVPVKGTPLESMGPISCNDAIKTISIFRIILEDKIIKIAAGRETVLKDFQGLGFLAGANGMLIGGYLTVKGRSIEADHELIKEIKRLWQE